MSNLRLYTFCNMYLSQIQQGIQSAHVLGDMAVKYNKARSSPLATLFWDWAENHKTMIVCNGGANQDIEEMYSLLAAVSSKSLFGLPYASFNEDVMSLGGVMTGCGIILPEDLYDAVDYRKAYAWFPLDNLEPSAYFFVKEGKIDKTYREGTPEHDLLKIVKSCRLA
jgi:hypothetical protein